MDHRLEQNKRTFTVYDLMSSQCKPVEALKSSGEVQIQHNPAVTDGKETSIKYFGGMAKEYRGNRVEFKRVVRMAEGQ